MFSPNQNHKNSTELYCTFQYIKFDTWYEIAFVVDGKSNGTNFLIQIQRYKQTRLVDFRSVFKWNANTDKDECTIFKQIDYGNIQAKQQWWFSHPIGKHTLVSCSSSITSAGSLRQISNGRVSHLEVLDLDLAREHSNRTTWLQAPL
ncbi:Hypothetical_protein [Hexamita inflata]|uniref:Hypothetical_protein n=1 Tax=Hexamita inflata TaxID=28002 RepID=A0AA86RCY5_9EUKA|nr:Hypothetical protein HINF_LOCUS61677 [Hexamita inflata]